MDTKNQSVIKPNLLEGLVSSDRQVCGGSLVFAGTRVSVKSLWDWLAGGYSLEEFLENFPTVSREQAVRAIEVAGELFEERLPTVADTLG